MADNHPFGRCSEPNSFEILTIPSLNEAYDKAAEQGTSRSVAASYIEVVNIHASLKDEAGCAKYLRFEIPCSAYALS